MTMKPAYRRWVLEMDRADRLDLIFDLIMAREPTGDWEGARRLLATAFNEIEDQHSDVPYNPDNWESDGRFYPPHDDFMVNSANPRVKVFHSRKHRIFFGINGSIRIQVRRGEDRNNIVLDKPGQDGMFCF
jgi:hypothetical protein